MNEYLNLAGIHEDKSTFRQAYIDGYKRAIKDMQKMNVKLLKGAELLDMCTHVSNQEMVDVIIPKELLEKLK